MEQSVFRSLELIEARISEKLTVENLATGVHFSKYHYQRIFREIVGDSVMAYVTKRKLTLAGKELLETDASVLKIALKFGFDTHEGFTRSFKAYMGVTPTQYRKYKLSAISQKNVKGEKVMYSKTTNEIIRELNDFIATAKETASTARKNAAPCWEVIAYATDAIADRVKTKLDSVTAIADNPDEITNRFAIMRAIDDAAFQSNLLAFNAGLMVSRGNPDEAKNQWHLYEKYRNLAVIAVQKSGKISEFLSELAALIFAEMRNAATEKINVIVQTGKVATDKITGHNNIKQEVESLINRIAGIPVEELTAPKLDDFLFQLSIISFAAKMDTAHDLQEKQQFDGLAELENSLMEAIEFFQTLIKPAPRHATKSKNQIILEDIGFQGNILLFYTRGEAEKLALDAQQKAAVDEICGKINNFIRLTQQATDETVYTKAAKKLKEIYTQMLKLSDTLKDQGGAIKFIATEFKGFADHVTHHASV